ncbi:Acyl-CoA synthetase member 2 mitochondrial [Bulinus truncatus]|nr:Acyl-CoA synthetase member 2 mitochondrial [Bulinus truncatus]
MIAGWSVGVPFAAMYHGDTRVLTDTFMGKATRTGKEIWEAVVKEEVTFCVLLCLEMDIVWEHIESIGGTDHTLKTVVSGGQPLRKPEYWTATGLQRGDVLRSHNSGRAIEGVEIRIVPEDGQLCQVNQTGTLEVRAPGVLKGYFNRLVDPDPQTVQAFTPDGWFMMSDYGHADEEGNIFVYGRAKDIIVYGGDLFYPGWMEKMLTKHADILEAIVVPVSDPVLYHNICACVKVRKDSELDEEGLRKHCDAIFLTNLGFSNTPHPKFFIITKDGFPLTSTGKPNKQRLREMAEERFGCNKDSV